VVEEQGKQAGREGVAARSGFSPVEVQEAPGTGSRITLPPKTQPLARCVLEGALAIAELGTFPLDLPPSPAALHNSASSNFLAYVWCYIGQS